MHRYTNILISSIWMEVASRNQAACAWFKKSLRVYMPPVIYAIRNGHHRPHTKGNFIGQHAPDIKFQGTKLDVTA